jgi:hypothetical protein
MAVPMGLLRAIKKVEKMADLMVKMLEHKLVVY